MGRSTCTPGLVYADSWVLIEAATTANRGGEGWYEKEAEGALEKATCYEQPGPRTAPQHWNYLK